MKEENQKVNADLILEVIGKPPEYLTNTLNGLIDQINKEQGIKVKIKDVKEPKKMEEKPKIAGSSKGKLKVEEQGDFYISFAEIEIEAESISNLTLLIFKYMPAHIEIMSPSSLTLTAGGWNEVLNELIRRLHGYDEIARVLQVEKAILENKLRSILNSSDEVKKKGAEQKNKESKTDKNEY